MDCSASPKYYSYGVNSLLQDNNFRGAEAILFEQENEKLYQVLLKMNLPIIKGSTIAQNATNEELNQAAEAYLKLAELTGGNNEGSLAYCIGNENYKRPWYWCSFKPNPNRARISGNFN